MHLALTASIGLHGFGENTHKEKNQQMSAISCFCQGKTCWVPAMQITNIQALGSTLIFGSPECHVQEQSGLVHP